jgi:CRISP-associated protein Cas1
VIKRTVDISNAGYLHVRNRQLCLEREGATVAHLPVEDLGVLILDHAEIVISQKAIALCQQSNVVILFCDERHLPLSVTLPLWSGHSLHTRVLRTQIEMTQPTRKRLWQEIVKEKIRQQSLTLERTGYEAPSLIRLRKNVKSGDPENCEAQAARQYWRALMGDSFRRDISGDGVNSLLNYGYAVMRAMVARAIVGTGLHPALGLHHKNQYNGLCLADDLMEPLRPWVDWEVFEMKRRGLNLEIDRSTKPALLQLLAVNTRIGGRTTPLMVAAHSMAAALKAAMSGKKRLLFPERVH